MRHRRFSFSSAMVAALIAGLMVGSIGGLLLNRSSGLARSLGGILLGGLAGVLTVLLAMKIEGWRTKRNVE